jgi:hypothetical protein
LALAGQASIGAGSSTGGLKRKHRAEGETLAAIAKSYAVDGSTISRLRARTYGAPHTTIARL